MPTFRTLKFWKSAAKKTIILIFFTLIISIYLILLKIKANQYISRALIEYEKIGATNKNIKTILYWNPFFNIHDFMFGFGQSAFIQAKCEITNCFITDYRPLIPIENFDAILFHPYDMQLSDLPKIRKAEQKYIVFNMESPETLDFVYFKGLENFFNLTATYRYDSDIPVLYGKLFEQNGSSGNEYFDGKEIVWRKRIKFVRNNNIKSSSKTKLIAWFVSDCKTQSKREIIVSEIQQYVSVDVYGECGALTCLEKRECYEMLDSDYKFYLSFENSLCPDYVTEKLFNILQYNVIPVVYGVANYSKFAPPHSYINIRDFTSIKQLVDYLLLLDKNDNLYNEYFWWKNFYTVREGRIPSFCNICKMLQDNWSGEIQSTYADFDDWWNVKGKCENEYEVLKKLNISIDEG